MAAPVPGPAPSMRPIRSISVLMPTFRGMEFLPRVLDALAAQECPLPWDLRAIDSSSDDGTWEYLQRRAADLPVPVALERIHGVEFDHGDTRNLLAARSRGDLLVFLTQDAIPAGPGWLAALARNFEDPAVGAAYCRNVPRPDAELLTKLFSAGDPGYTPGRREERVRDLAAWRAADPHTRRLACNFNDVASAVRRELWERHPFPRTPFGEDILMARALLEAGFTVVYDDEATVEHSHDYDAAETRARARVDARFNAEYLGRTCVGSPADARVLVERQLEADRAGLVEAGLAGRALEAELERARELRVAAFEGLYEGGLTERRFPATRVLPEDGTHLHVLFVVHGFPPDTWAGTEIYTFNLARELEARGHRCTILHRAPADREPSEGGPPDFSVEEGEFQGLRVLRLTNRLRHRSLRDSYQDERAEEAFARVLRRERPDVVHFQHLIHTSAGLVEVARRAGLPTVVHCHDYWALCARVQLIRPDGRRCEENQGAGCFACVKDRSSLEVDLLARLGDRAGPMLASLERELEPGPGPGGDLARRLGGFGDLLARHDFVTAAYAAADLRISPSRFLRETYLASGRFEPHTFLFSDNGMRTDHVRALEKRPDPAGRVRFGFVGSLVWYKGGEVMVRAMQRLDPRRAVLNVYGGFEPESDPHHAELARLAEGHPVEFRGRFDNARLSEVYAEIDVLVVPSTWFENSPITIHEAFLTGTPVLASDIGGMAEYVRDGVDGLWFAVGDAEDLARKMQRLVDEPELLAALGRDLPAVKTIAEDAEAMEFRYRGLVCRDRSAEVEAAARLARASGAELQRVGAAELQGADLALVRPGEGNALELDVRGCGGGPRELLVTSLALAAEPELRLAGRVLVDGVEVARLAELGGGAADEERTERLLLELPEDAAVLRLEPEPGRFLRVRALDLRVAEEVPA
jgi:glycosyltransferase involved in cell wall biosynthesis/GT2 family glycosyltransferase